LLIICLALSAIERIDAGTFAKEMLSQSSSFGDHAGRAVGLVQTAVSCHVVVEVSLELLTPSLNLTFLPQAGSYLGRFSICGVDSSSSTQCYLRAVHEHLISILLHFSFAD